MVTGIMVIMNSNKHSNKNRNTKNENIHNDNNRMGPADVEVSSPISGVHCSWWAPLA